MNVLTQLFKWGRWMMKMDLVVNYWDSVVNCVCTRYVMLCTRYVMLCTRYVMLCTRYVMLCTRYVMLCTRYVMLCTRYVMLCTRYVMLCTRYLDSTFLGHSRSRDLLHNFLLCLKSLNKTKLIQVSMDGSNANWAFYSELHNYRDENNINKLIQTG